MDLKVIYAPCSLSEEDLKGNKMGARCKTWKNWALAGTTLLALIFLGLFVWQLFSKQASQTGDCQAQLQNQTAKVNAQLEMCTDALKRDRDKAKEQSDDLRAQLLVATQSLNNSSQHWDSCQKQLHNMQDNITSQNKEISAERVEKQKLQEEIKQLQQQISERKNQKEESKDSGTTIHKLGINLHFLLLALLLL